VVYDRSAPPVVALLASPSTHFSMQFLSVPLGSSASAASRFPFLLACVGTGLSRLCVVLYRHEHLVGATLGREMSTMVEQQQTGPGELTHEQGYELLDEQTRAVLGMTAKQFMQAWDAGEFDSQPEQPQVTDLAMLIPFAR